MAKKLLLLFLDLEVPMISQAQIVFPVPGRNSQFAGGGGDQNCDLGLCPGPVPKTCLTKILLMSRYLFWSEVKLASILQVSKVYPRVVLELSHKCL